MRYTMQSVIGEAGLDTPRICPRGQIAAVLIRVGGRFVIRLRIRCRQKPAQGAVGETAGLRALRDSHQVIEWIVCIGCGVIERGWIFHHLQQPAQRVASLMTDFSGGIGLLRPLLVIKRRARTGTAVVGYFMFSSQDDRFPC